MESISFELLVIEPIPLGYKAGAKVRHHATEAGEGSRWPSRNI